MNRFRIAVVTMTCPRYSGIAEVSLPNMKEYCDIHGYLNSVIQLPETEGFHYKKHEFFKEAFNLLVCAKALPVPLMFTSILTTFSIAIFFLFYF